MSLFSFLFFLKKNRYSQRHCPVKVQMMGKVVVGFGGGQDAKIAHPEDFQ